MFDLEYYNEITDYNRIYEEIMEGRRQLYNTKVDKKRRMEYIEYTEKCIRDMSIFERKHTLAYNNWYNNYYNKLPIKSLKTTWTDEYYESTNNRLNAF